MKIITAESSGFCSGVKNAIKEAEKATSEQKLVYCLGEIVHNKHVVNKLKKAGLTVVYNLDDISTENGTVILSAHGVSPEIIKKAENKKVSVINTTCPKVKKVQKLAMELNDNGYCVILTGDKFHPEVKGVVKWGYDKVKVISDIEEAKSLPFDKPLGIISQTTFSTELFEQIITYIKSMAQNDVIIKNTICKATETRQKEAEELSKITDTMIIIGGTNSANTKRLYEISLKYTKNSFWITDADELNKDMLKNSKVIGITAGASTPADIIKDVEKKVMELKNDKH